MSARATLGTRADDRALIRDRVRCGWQQYPTPRRGIPYRPTADLPSIIRERATGRQSLTITPIVRS